MLLAGGYTNIVDRNRDIVIKQYCAHKKSSIPPRLRRNKEASALRRYKGTSVTPEFVGMDSSTLAQQYLKGALVDSLLSTGKTDDQLLFEAGQLLRKIHKPVERPRVSLKDRYFQELLDYVPRALTVLVDLNFNARKIYKDLRDINFSKLYIESTYIHGDFCFINIISTTNGLKAIDWEYAGEGNPYEDFAQIEMLGLQLYDLDSEMFWEGYGIKPDATLLKAFIVKRILTYMALESKTFIKDSLNGSAFNKHLIKILHKYYD